MYYISLYLICFYLGISNISIKVICLQTAQCNRGNICLMTQNLYVSVSRYNFNYFWPEIDLFYRCFFTSFHSSNHSLSLICVHWLHCVQCFMISSIPHVERFWNVIFCMYSISFHLSVSKCFAWLNINYMEVHLWTLNVKVISVWSSDKQKTLCFQSYYAVTAPSLLNLPYWCFAHDLLLFTVAPWVWAAVE